MIIPFLLALWAVSGVVACILFARHEGVLYLTQAFLFLLTGPVVLMTIGIIWMDKWDPMIWRKRK